MHLTGDALLRHCRVGHVLGIRSKMSCEVISDGLWGIYSASIL